MYVRCERTLIIVGDKRRIYSPSFECLILSVDIPEQELDIVYGGTEQWFRDTYKIVVE